MQHHEYVGQDLRWLGVVHRTATRDPHHHPQHATARPRPARGSTGMNKIEVHPLFMRLVADGSLNLGHVVRRIVDAYRDDIAARRQPGDNERYVEHSTHTAGGYTPIKL